MTPMTKFLLTFPLGIMIVIFGLTIPDRLFSENIYNYNTYLFMKIGTISIGGLYSIFIILLTIFLFKKSKVTISEEGKS